MPATTQISGTVAAASGVFASTGRCAAVRNRFRSSAVVIGADGDAGSVRVGAGVTPWVMACNMASTSTCRHGRSLVTPVARKALRCRS